MIADENSIIFYLAKRCEFPPQAGCPALARKGKAGTSDTQHPAPFWVPVIAAKPRIAAETTTLQQNLNGQANEQ